MIQKRTTFYVALLSKNNLLINWQCRNTVTQYKWNSVQSLSYYTGLSNDCSMFCAVLVAFEVLPHMICWRRMN